MPKGRARKLIPKYIGPIKVLQKNSVINTYTLDLPENMRKRHIYPTFHIRLLCQYEENDDILFQKRDVQVFYDVRKTEEEEWLVNEIIKRLVENRGEPEPRPTCISAVLAGVGWVAYCIIAMCISFLGCV